MGTYDRYCPEGEPYKKEEILTDLSVEELQRYVTELVSHVEAIGVMYQREQWHIHFLGNYLRTVKKFTNEGIAPLRKLPSRVRCLDAWEKTDARPTIDLPGVKQVSWKILPDPTGLTEAQVIQMLKDHLS